MSVRNLMSVRNNSLIFKLRHFSLDQSTGPSNHPWSDTASMNKIWFNSCLKLMLSTATHPDYDHSHSDADGSEALTFTHCEYLSWHLSHLSFSSGILEMVIELAYMNLKIS